MAKVDFVTFGSKCIFPFIIVIKTDKKPFTWTCLVKVQVIC